MRWKEYLASLSDLLCYYFMIRIAVVVCATLNFVGKAFNPALILKKYGNNEDYGGILICPYKNSGTTMRLNQCTK